MLKKVYVKIFFMTHIDTPITRVGYESITNWYSLCNPSTRSWIFFMDNMFQRWITTSNPIFNSTILQQCDVFRYIFCDDNFHAKYYFFR